MDGWMEKSETTCEWADDGSTERRTLISITFFGPRDQLLCKGKKTGLWLFMTNRESCLRAPHYQRICVIRHCSHELEKSFDLRKLSARGERERRQKESFPI